MNERRKVDAIARTLCIDFNYTNEDAYRVAYAIVRSEACNEPSAFSKLTEFFANEKQYLFLLFAFILGNTAAVITSLVLTIVYAVSAVMCIIVAFVIALSKA